MLSLRSFIQNVSIIPHTPVFVVRSGCSELCNLPIYCPGDVCQLKTCHLIDVP